ncbi:MAG: hypothetical protein PF588_09840 [Candidatus Kapabacteria bacterium]|jgi:hypothetical protein|nr:hypothetical protein [Candidatus Kapabacteria bacterium]
MQAADIEAYVFNSGIDTLKIEPDANGKFDLVFDHAEKVVLNFYGSDHMSYTLPLYTKWLNESFDLKINLKAYSLPADLRDLRVLGSFNDYDYHSAIPMTLRPDGKYEALIQNNTDTIQYQIIGITSEEVGRSINGTAHDFLIFDGEGDYISAIVSSEKEVKIIFDPAKRKYHESNPSATSSAKRITNYLEKHF